MTPGVLSLDAELSAAEPPVPVLVVDAGGGLADRVEAVRPGAGSFLRTPLGARQVLEAVTGVLERPQPPRRCWRSTTTRRS
ncbi:MAG TPA: hypothetical protein VG452_06065 [Egibacteraceae bacterium]|nr:hypothetical protein [Egibacteraceae bacterium]